MTTFLTRASRAAERAGQKFCTRHHFYYKTECLRCTAEQKVTDLAISDEMDSRAH
jgi:hypothetical protein